MVLPIYLDPHKMLRDKSELVTVEQIKSDEFQKLLDNMIETMIRAEGIGLAGTQVSKLWRVTVVDTSLLPPLARGGFTSGARGEATQSGWGGVAVINPTIKRKSLKKNLMEEGCLSIPGIYGTVKRPEKIAVDFLDRAGKPVTLKSDGLLARVLQHEIDHMDGVLFTDKVIELTQTKKIQPRYEHVTG